MQRDAQDTVLLVDDEQAHRMLARRAFQREFQTLRVEEGDSLDTALKLFSAAQRPFSLVVVDLNLAGTSGLALVKRIRESYNCGELPVIVISTSELPEEIWESYQAGANCFVTKSGETSRFERDLISAAAFLLKSAG